MASHPASPQITNSLISDAPSSPVRRLCQEFSTYKRHMKDVYRTETAIVHLEMLLRGDLKQLSWPFLSDIDPVHVFQRTCAHCHNYYQTKGIECLLPQLR